MSRRRFLQRPLLQWVSHHGRGIAWLSALTAFCIFMESSGVKAAPITWNQPTGGDFNTAGNWTPSTIPGAADTAIFNIALSGNVTQSANAAPGSISFDTNATSFALGTLGGYTLTLANNGATSVLSTLTTAGQTFTINAPLILTPASTTTAGTYTIQNDGTSSSTTLVIAGNISSSTTSNTETLTLAGANTGANTISGIISNGAASNVALVKSGTGTWMLTGVNTYSGGTSIAAGTLALTGGNNRLLSTGTLGFTGSSGTLDVASTSQTMGSLALTASVTGSNTYTITGTGGTLTLNNGNFTLGGGNALASGSQTLNMSGLSTFVYNRSTGSFNVGGATDNASTSVIGNGVLSLATNNSITAASFNVAYFSTGANSLNSGTVHLGQTNVINASTFVVGVQKTTALLDFQNLVAPTLKIRGTGGTDADRAAITIGTNSSGLTNSVSTMDLTSGGTVVSTLDAMVSTLTIGQNIRNATSVGFAATGTFTMALGSLNATTIILGQQTALTGTNTFSGQATGTLNLNGGTITVTTFTLADKQSGAATQTITANFNLNSGTLNATTIQRGALGTTTGAATATINFNWVDGTIGNIAGADMTVNGNSAVSGLTGGLNIVLNNTGNVSGTHTWNVTGTQTATIQSSAILSGSGSLTKTGTGTLVFAGANTYTGLTTVTAGELDLNTSGGQAIAGNLTVSGGTTKLLQDSQVNTASTLLVSGGTFNLQTFNQTLGNVQLAGGAITGTTGVLTSSTAYDLRSGSATAILAGTAGVTKTAGGTVILSGANTYSGGTVVNGGLLVGASTTALGSNSSLTVNSGGTFAYRPTAAGTLTLGTGAINLTAGSTIGAALAGTASQSVISSTVTATASGAVGVNLYFIPGVAAATGANNLVTAASGLTSGGATYTLGAIYNNTGYTLTGFAATDTVISVNVATATALTTAYWKGGLGIGNNVWAVSTTSASNWSTTAAGTGATALVPGSTTTVTFSATGATNQSAMTLGANMTIRNITVSDTNAVTLNADGNTLTIANAAGIVVNSGAGAVTLNAPITLGVSQTWSNSSSNALTIGGAVTMGTNTLAVTGTGNTTISGAVNGTGAINKTGAGTLTLSGSNTTTGNLNVGTGTVSISGSYNGAINVGTTSATNGVLIILAGARVNLTSSLTPGSGVGGIGVVNQSGGDAVALGQMIFGAGGSGAYGFYNMSGGTLTEGDRFRIGGAISNSIGVLYQSGGSILLTAATNGNGLEVGANAGGPATNSTGVAYITGGTLTGIQNHIGYDGSSGGVRGEQTVAGTAIVTINGITTIGQTAADFGVLNLNGGIYATKQIVKGTNGTGIVNFNGGTLKAAAGATSGFFTGLTAVNIFSGGATIDTNGQTLIIAQSLLAPTGSGVTTVAVTNGGSGYVGAPYVSISGVGSGATAVANMVDDGTGNGTLKIGSITITSSGTGYTSAPTVSVSGGGGTGAVFGTVTTAANLSGGFTKTGTGTLTLSGTNTYTGATVVNSGGTLIAGGTSAFGVNSAATVDGTMRINSNAITLGSLSGAGTVENASSTAATLTVGSDNSLTTFAGVIQNGAGTGALSLTKIGNGVQALTGVNTFTGATLISQGTLQVGSGGAGSLAAGSAVTVNGASATLAGTGTVNGAVTVTSGSVRPGDAGGTSVGNLTASSLNLATGGTAFLQIEGISSSDKITVVSANGLTLDGKISVTTSLTGTAFDTTFAYGNSFDLLDWAGSLAGVFDVGANFRDGSADNALQFDLPDISSLSRNWDVSNFLSTGVITVVPEPGRAMLMTVALAAMLSRRRRPTVWWRVA